MEGDENEDFFGVNFGKLPLLLELDEDTFLPTLGATAISNSSSLLEVESLFNINLTGDFSLAELDEDESLFLSKL